MKPNQLKRQAGVAGTILLTCLFALSLRAWAQAPSSRQIPFSGVVTTIQGPLPAQTLTLRVLDNSTPPVALYCETQTLDVNENGAISFNLGAGAAANPPCPSAPPGLNPADFASGSTRSLDVVDTNGNSVLANPIPLTAVAFALSPGPAGPTGPQGPAGAQGPQGAPGPPGVVQAIIAGDGSVTVAGTATTPSVAVAANGITNAHISNGALSPAKVTGVAATLGSNTFNGAQSLPANGLVAGTSQLVLANGNVGVGTASPTSVLHVAGSQPAAAGANAAPVLQITGGKGGNADPTSSTGGTSASVNITAGAGGDVVSGGTTDGSGGSVTIQGGAAGAGATLGGNGGSVTIQGGTGNTGASIGGAGGSITLQPGAGTAGILGGPSGNVLLAPSNGNVGIGTAAPAFAPDVNGTAHTSSFSGNGAGLTGVSASGLAAGTYSNAYTFNNAGNAFTGSFSGNGSALTGVVQTVSAGDASITVGGSATNPNVAVAANGVTNAKVANGALSPSKITGTAAVLSGDTFSGPLEVAPNSTSYALRIDQGGNGHGLFSYVNTTASNKIVFAAASLAGGGST